MRLYLFVLGRNPVLSLAEIISYLRNKNFSFEIIEHTDEIAKIEIENFNSKEHIKNLGGTLKIAYKIDSLNDIVLDKNKIRFSVSGIHFDKDLLIKKLKNKLKEENVKAIIKYGKSDLITPKQSKNLDLEIVGYKDELYFVEAVSDPYSYKQRDIKRPAYDPLKSTSIRLAKIMINLAQPKKEIADPFCGQGTILQEALIMNYNCIGLDLNAKESRINLKWLGNKYNGKYKVIDGDARRLSKYLKEAECIVTEPYLGPYLKRKYQLQDLMRIIKELNFIYSDFIKETSKIIKGKIVVIVPGFKFNSRLYKTDFDRIIRENKLKVVAPLNSINMPLHYKVKGSIIERFIYILERQ